MTATSKEASGSKRPQRRRGRSLTAMVVAALALAGCSGSSGSAKATAGVDSVGPATRTFHRSEVFGVTTLAELGALSDHVVEAKVASVGHGPAMGDGEGLNYLIVTLNVTKSYKGAEKGASVKVLMIGYNPKDGATYTGDGEHWPEPGTTGIWYLGDADTEELKGFTYPRTSAGQILNSDGIGITGGDQQVAAVLCRVPWEQAQLAVEKSVADSEGTKPLEATEPSPGADPAFAGNPCAASEHDDETESQPTAPEGE